MPEAVLLNLADPLSREAQLVGYGLQCPTGGPLSQNVYHALAGVNTLDGLGGILRRLPDVRAEESEKMLSEVDVRIAVQGNLVEVLKHGAVFLGVDIDAEKNKEGTNLNRRQIAFDNIFVAASETLPALAHLGETIRRREELAEVFPIFQNAADKLYAQRHGAVVALFLLHRRLGDVHLNGDFPNIGRKHVGKLVPLLRLYNRFFGIPLRFFAHAVVVVARNRGGDVLHGPHPHVPNPEDLVGSPGQKLGYFFDSRHRRSVLDPGAERKLNYAYPRVNLGIDVNLRSEIAGRFEIYVFAHLPFL